MSSQFVRCPLSALAALARAVAAARAIPAAALYDTKLFYHPKTFALGKQMSTLFSRLRGMFLNGRRCQTNVAKLKWLRIKGQ